LLISRFWQILLGIFTILLLFGAQIQWLFLPKEADIVFDVLFTIALVVFSLDIVLRCYLEPNYFNFCGSGSNVNGEQGRAVNAWGGCHIGSFMFWCDFISTLTLLYNITYINRTLTEESGFEVKLDPFGAPVEGLDQINKASPVEYELQLLVSIGRTARVARFIRTSTVVKTSSKVNWYWMYQRVNPVWYWQNFQRWRRGKRNDRNSAFPSRNASMQSREEAYNNSGNSRGNNNGLVRHASWGGVQLHVLAAVQQGRMVEERRQQQQVAEKESTLDKIRRGMKRVGFLRTDDEDVRRHIAATKIQRAWKAVALHQHAGSPGSDGEHEEDVAWVSRRSLDDPNPIDRIMTKRSMMRTHLGTTLTANKARRSMLPMKNTLSRRRPESQVGSAMRELTGQRVAIGIIVALILTVLFTYSENDATRASTMIVLHTQTQNEQFANASLEAARSSSIPELYEYIYTNGTRQYFEASYDPDDLRDRERLRITISQEKSDLITNLNKIPTNTTGFFVYKSERRGAARVELFSTIFILLVWFLGVGAFAGPVMTLVVIPIERMVRLLGMLMLDPLGYQSTPKYKKFDAEADELTKNTRWTKEVLKGMETSFLMSTILRIGSLMKVGFGSAGVEIIRNNLEGEPGQSKNTLILNEKGSTVSCIFLFCDIRQFTDATECLQEEVFVFTNRIAAVVHSYCHAYGGSANKNVGDAFLLSWLLEDEAVKPESRRGPGAGGVASYQDVGGGYHHSPAHPTDTFTAKSNQADKALLSVVKICMALHYDDYYLSSMSEAAREALLAKLKDRPGPVVQMGFGLHAGKAVQGAIGSQRKIDATYVSEAVERAEFLESSTKKYGLQMLMSDSFHRLLHPSNRRRCRKIDQILLTNDDDEDNEDGVIEGDVMELFTFDMDIDALWKKEKRATLDDDTASDTGSINESGKGSKRDGMQKQASSSRHPGRLHGPRRRSMNRLKFGVGDITSEEFKSGGSSGEATSPAGASPVSPLMTAASSTELVHGHQVGESQDPNAAGQGPPELVLPNGPALYNANVWLSGNLKKIRERFLKDGLFFQKFMSGLQSYYARDWEHAQQCFQTTLERCDDGPSQYFLNKIKEHNGVPPRNFLGYGTA